MAVRPQKRGPDRPITKEEASSVSKRDGTSIRRNSDGSVTRKEKPKFGSPGDILPDGTKRGMREVTDHSPDSPSTHTSVGRGGGSRVDNKGGSSPTANISTDHGVERPELRGTDIGDLYGLTYDKDAIRGKFDAATKAEFDRKRKEYAGTEAQYAGHMHDTQRTALDSLRQDRSQAVATGATRGMQAAQELSTVLGLGQEGVEGATELAQQRNLLADREAEAYTQNVVEALSEANRLSEVMGQLDTQAYAADTQFGVGEMDHHARIQQAQANLEGMGLQADAQRYTADRSLEGTEITALKNLLGTKFAAEKELEGADLTSERNLAGTVFGAQEQRAASEYRADQQRAGTEYTANQNLASQKIAAAAQRDAAKISAEGQMAAANLAEQRPDIAEQLDNFKKKGQKDAYVITAMGNANISKDEAVGMWENHQADDEGTTPDSPNLNLSPTLEDAMERYQGLPPTP